MGKHFYVYILASRKHGKRWRRDWKVELIERDNPNWDDLYSELI